MQMRKTQFEGIIAAWIPVIMTEATINIEEYDIVSVLTKIKYDGSCFKSMNYYLKQVSLNRQ